MPNQFTSTHVARNEPLRCESVARAFGCAFMVAALALTVSCASGPRPKPPPERRTVERQQVDGDKYSAAMSLGDAGNLIVEVTRTAKCEFQVRQDDEWLTERVEPCVRPTDAGIDVELHVVLDFTPGYRQPKLKAKLDAAGKAAFQFVEIKKTLLWLKGNDGPALPVQIRVRRPDAYGPDLLNAQVEALNPVLEEWAIDLRKALAAKTAEAEGARAASWASTTQDEVRGNRCDAKRYRDLETIEDAIAQNALSSPVVLSTHKISVIGPKARADLFKPAHSNVFHFVAVGYGPVQLDLIGASGKSLGPSPSVHMQVAAANVAKYGLKFDTLVAKVGSQDGAALRVSGAGCVLVMVFAQQE